MTADVREPILGFSFCEIEDADCSLFFRPLRKVPQSRNQFVVFRQGGRSVKQFRSFRAKLEGAIEKERHHHDALAKVKYGVFYCERG